MAVSRRELLQRTGALGLGMAFAGSLDSVFGAAASAAAPAGEAYGYGPLVPDPAEVLDLPEGFTYRTFSHFMDEVPGGLVPDRHDGMCAFALRRSTVLVRNHEAAGDAVRVPAPPELTYDEPASGGCMTLQVDRRLELVSQAASLGGTVRNCAGGRTPWRTWLTCEETELRAGAPGRDGVPYTRDHGWVFEVHPFDGARNVAPVPLTAMGRFAHEAVAVDPETHVAYLTEDASDPYGLFYRFTPHDAGGGYGSYRAGGLLEALRVPGLRDLSTVTRPGTRFSSVRWVPVPDPLATSTSVRRQLADDEVTRSQKLEGAWWARGSVHFAASYSRSDGSDGRRAHEGQVWRYDPRRRTLTLQMVFTGDTRFGSPDNITISPFGGGVVIAEDGGNGQQYLVGVTRHGRPFPIARNALNSAELAGVTFDAEQQTLFGNIYGGRGGGRTFAVRGPWHALSSAPAGV